MGFLLTVQVMIGVLVTSGSVDSTLLTATYKSQSLGSLPTVDMEYNGIPSSQLCSLLCTERTATQLSACFSYSYNSASQICKLSPDWNTEVTGQTTNEMVFEVQEYQIEASTYIVRHDQACRRELEQLDISFEGCFELLESSSTFEGDWSYDAAQRACYNVAPMLSADYTCPIYDEIVPILSNRNAARSLFGNPTKLTLAGPFDGSDPYVDDWGYAFSVTIAFDGSTAYGNHYLSARGSENPWIGGDIGDMRTIAGAFFYTRTNCCAQDVQNIHFLVATTESSLTEDYDESLCSVHTGFPPMNSNDVVWFPCPFHQGRYFRMVSFTASGKIDVCEVELIGY